jgi:putative membrane protein
MAVARQCSAAADGRRKDLSMRPLSRLLVFGFVLVLASPAFAQNPPKPSDQNPPDAARAGDADFVKEAGLGGMTEVELSRIALQKSSDAAVKKFAQQMVTDHTKAGQALQAAASQEGLTPPAQLDPEHKQLVDRFSSLSGAAFDNEYKSQMLKDHEETVAKFEREAASGNGSPVQKFASSTLPTLKTHLKMAQELNGGAQPHAH